MVRYEQGDLIRIENLNGLFLVVSNNALHHEETAMVCPVTTNRCDHPLHISIYDDAEHAYTVLCEHVMLRDLSTRGYSVAGRIPYGDLINVSDAIQGIFEY